MKCDFCDDERADCLHVGYGILACEDCQRQELIKIPGGWAFKPGHKPAVALERAHRQARSLSELGGRDRGGV